MITKIACYVSRGTDPYVNLATENYLLNLVDDDTLILYLWQNKNTVVIGKNQNPWAECRCALLEEDGGRLARRSSGGGAVYHDLGNLNFTFLSSAQNFDVPLNMQIIQKACAAEGITAEVSGRNDITADGKKFSGNAFYNAKGKCYHHGTLLICSDREKMLKYLTPPKAKLLSKGVKSVGARVVNLSELSPTITPESMAQSVAKAFAETFGTAPAMIEEVDTEYVSNLSKQYGSWEYLYGKTINFSLAVEDHFTWGQIRVLLKIEDGIITDVQTYTDAMDSTLPETIAGALSGCRYDLPTVSARLSAAFDPTVSQDLVSLFEQQGF